MFIIIIMLALPKEQVQLRLQEDVKQAAALDCFQQPSPTNPH